MQTLTGTSINNVSFGSNSVKHVLRIYWIKGTVLNIFPKLDILSSQQFYGVDIIVPILNI